MNNQFLIPANTKKSLLIFNVFREIDLGIFAGGIATTMLLVIILPLTNIYISLAALMPAFITGFLVMPVANYHNVLTVLINFFTFKQNRQRYVWRGWCFKDGEQ